MSHCGQSWLRSVVKVLLLVTFLPEPHSLVISHGVRFEQYNQRQGEANLFMLYVEYKSGKLIVTFFVF